MKALKLSYSQNLQLMISTLLTNASLDQNDQADPNDQTDLSDHIDQNDHPIHVDEILNDDQQEHFNLGDGMLTRAMAKELSDVLAHECLFVDFISKEEPKKVSKALKHLGCVDSMQEELNQFCQKQSLDTVARLEAIRIFLAFATYMNFIVYQMDVKSAFLNGKMKEEVYVKQPLGFESSEFPNHVCKLDKSLYRLKQAPRYGFDLKEYSDSDYAGCNMDRKITSSAYQLLGGKLMCWSAKNQQYVAMSLVEPEYVAAARCCANILWMKILHSRTKLIDIIYHFIRDHILKGDIELHVISTQYQLADIFTKPLDEPTFKRLIVKLGMLNIDGSKPEPSNDSSDKD
ncbi:retrovirus-related pol polyprotein from transposon TNT 1-94 [Tanacetum coccineum]